jgi:tRNA(Ile)-lysidine synthase
MEVALTSPGTYVVAVSGGVDSMVLLHALHAGNLARADRPWRLVVAHLDHDMRSDSAEDRRFVAAAARQLGLPYIYEEARLGAAAGEAAARTARYGFLRRVQREHDARAVVTAHHQDDVLETAVINLLRGTGRKGLTALAGRPGLERPLLDVPKRDIIAYAEEHGITWREDNTNDDTDYLRNYVRHELLPRFDADGRRRLRRIIDGLRVTNAELDGLLTGQLAARAAAGGLDRAWFTALPHDVAREVMAAWLRGRGAAGFGSRTLERLVVAAKTAAPGRRFDVPGGWTMRVQEGSLALRRKPGAAAGKPARTAAWHSQAASASQKEKTRV